ncbi:MAG: prefoldin subunit beta [Nitrososphaerales archaeon]
MSREEVPPWLREQLVRFEQAQQSLQAILVQKQQVEMELTEVEKALSELSKATTDTTVYKSAGSLLIKTSRDAMLKELEERRELGNTRVTVLAKQENRIRESLKEIQAKIEEATRGGTQPKGN